MSEFRIIKFNFTSPLHLSRGITDHYGVSSDWFHSDALKSALFAAAFHHIPESYRNERFFAAFSVSSCFPFHEDTFFLPKPRMALKLEFSDETDSGNAKKAKRLQFLDLESWNHLVNGGKLLLNPSGFDASGKWYKHDVPKGMALEAPMTHHLQEQVCIPPQGSPEDAAPVPFNTDRIYFRKNSGLYFFFQLHEPEFEPIFMEALKCLEWNGIGTDRSLGNGHFQVSIHPQMMQLGAHNGNAWLNLGLYLPKDQESLAAALEGNPSYSLVKRGGFMAGSTREPMRNLRKRSVYMFDICSVFQSNQQPFGRLTDLRPNTPDIHPVWRDGAPLFVPVLSPQA